MSAQQIEPPRLCMMATDTRPHCPCLLPQQSLNMLQGETKPIRRHIEARFDEIKGITESPHPYLDMELSSW